MGSPVPTSLAFKTSGGARAGADHKPSRDSGQPHLVGPDGGGNSEVARESGFRSLEVHSDPHAVEFYRRRGARLVGTIPSGSIPGRVLPLLRIDLTRQL
jgi:hypothetical protein